MDGELSTRRVDREGNEEETIQERSIDPASRWADFRRLCLYYAECVRLEERASISAYAEKEGADFICLPGPIDWRAVSSGQKIRLIADSAWERFLRQGRTHGPCTTLYFGTPTDVFVGQDRNRGGVYRIISPVFVTSVVAKLGNGWLEIQPTDLVEINHGWLERRLTRAQHRKEFLEQIGLTPTSLQDDEQEDLWAVNGFEETTRLLFSCRQNWWKEYPDLQRLGTDPPFSGMDESGLRNRAVLMIQPALRYTKRLYSELRRLAFEVGDEDFDQTALIALFPHKAPPKQPVENPDSVSCSVDAAEFCLLNDDQRTACVQALTEALTVVTGPPGTGKSMVVAHALANSALRGRAALFASRNHQAIEAVEPRLNAMTEPETLVLRPTRPFGAQAVQFEWYRGMTTLLSRPRREGIVEEKSAADAAVQSDLALRRELEFLMADLLRLEEELVEAEAGLRDALQNVPASWQAVIKTMPRLPAREAVSRLRATVEWFSRVPSKWLLRAVLWPLQVYRLHAARNQFRSLAAEIGSTEGGVMVAIPEALKPSPTEMREVCDQWLLLINLVQAAQRCDSIKKRLVAAPNRNELGNQLRETNARLESATLQWLRIAAESAGASISSEQREIFAQLRAAMHNRPHELNDSAFTSEVGKAFREAMPELMQHFPLWAVSNLSVSRAIPLAPAVFDLVIVDEASQCDIASVVPLLYRARRALIVGDPNQLPHVTQISRDTEMRIREQIGVSEFAFERHTFAANSMFDLAASSRNRTAIELRSHYRCHPEIAEYCNSTFYNRTLWIMTDADALRARVGLNRTARACTWHHVPGDAVPASSGCHSPAQLKAVLDELVRLREQGFAGSVGVVTPFRAQATRINDAVHDRFRQDCLAAWRFLVDTADGFQGDERDLILFSLVGNRGMPAGSAHFLQSTPNRFNVAVSRAKVAIAVFGDEQWAESCGIPFVAQLLRRCRSSQDGSQSVRRADLIGPVWEPRFAEALRSAGLPFEQQYPTCGHYLDFALFPQGRKIAVEIDGETYHRAPGGQRRIDDIYRDLVLEAAGWRVLRFWVYQVRENIDECIERVRSEYE